MLVNSKVNKIFSIPIEYINFANMCLYRLGFLQPRGL